MCATVLSQRKISLHELRLEVAVAKKLVLVNLQILFLSRENRVRIRHAHSTHIRSIRNPTEFYPK